MSDSEEDAKYDRSDDSQEYFDENLIIEDFNKNLTRLRPIRVSKDRKCDCSAILLKLLLFIQSIFQKCGLCMEDESSSTPSIPPKRYLYWGPKYDTIDKESNTRSIRFAHLENEDDSLFCSNYISTTKYTMLTFIPLNLIEQFMKKANLYFLIIASLSFTDLSPKLPVFSVLPLTFVLAVSAVKEAYEDYKRYEMDNEINNRKVDVVRPDENGENWEFQSTTWQNIEVGDILRIHKSHPAFPTDMLILQSSTNQGLCNIETANLDGETNLKIKQAVSATYVIETDGDGSAYVYNPKLQFKLESEAPHEDIAKWTGALTFYDREEKVSVGMNQFVLRGCTLRNTEWVIGIAVFTGVESKIALNNKATKFKRSNVDRVVDKALYVIFATQACMCLFGVFSHLVWLESNAGNQWYQYIDSSGNDETDYGSQAVLNYFTFVVLLDLFVPISLYVSMELVKFTQATLINFDDDMAVDIELPPKPKKKGDEKEEKVDAVPTKLYAQARTSNLNEELGQISFIFSDKTGTLTENKMSFLRCHVHNTRYGPKEMEKQHAFVERIVTPDGMPVFDEEKCLFTDNRLAHESSDRTTNEFLTLLSICHSIIPEYPSGQNGPISYNASSPDEKALVMFAKNVHYYFFYSTVVILEYNDHILDANRFSVNIHSDIYDFDVYNMLEFSSKRKRMSVIVRDPRDGKLKLYCKGADNVIYQRLTERWKDSDVWERTLESLQVFASDGLRTLVCAYRELSDEYYGEWLDRLMKAKATVSNRKQLVAKCYDEIEREFELLGVTAIEDKLQKGVPSTIHNLANAGISIWVLTGDKVETAINIGRSCRLLTPRMNKEDRSLYIVDPDERMPFDECSHFVNDHLAEALDFLADKEMNDSNQGFVISGKALSYVFPHRKHDAKGKEIPPTEEEMEVEEVLQKKLFQILSKCRAVICCRVSPIQKAQIVQLVKNNCPGVITLAIGDGANDVPMIRTAHVGIGISGQEGLQAVMASDYSIAQFRFLQELLLIHGAWDYRRISTLILYSFYKNITFSLTNIWFSFFCGYSGTLYYDQLSGSCFNMVFTAMPVLFAAVFDRPYSKAIARVCPELYAAGPANSCFNLRIFGLYCLQGVAHATILFFTATFYIDSSSISSSGVIVGFWTSATTLFTALVSVVTLKMMLETSTWTQWSLLIFGISELLWFLFALIWSALPQTLGWGNAKIYGVAQVSMGLPQYWFVVILAIVLCLMPEIVIKYIMRMYWPTRLNIIEELEMYKPKKKQFLAEIAAHMQLEKQENEQQFQDEVAHTSDTTHLGFSEFQVGEDHQDYIISQQRYISLAMKKPKFSNLPKMLQRKGNAAASVGYKKGGRQQKNVSGIEEQENPQLKN